MLAAALLALAGCDGPQSVEDASMKVATFHQRLDAEDYEAILNDSGPDIREGDSRAFMRLLAAVNGKLGKVRESKQTGWRSQVDTAGSFTEVIMQTTFERGRGEETFIYKGSGAEQKLAGYHINSDEMMLR